MSSNKYNYSRVTPALANKIVIEANLGWKPSLNKRNLTLTKGQSRNNSLKWWSVILSCSNSLQTCGSPLRNRNTWRTGWQYFSFALWMPLPCGITCIESFPFASSMHEAAPNTQRGQGEGEECESNPWKYQRNLSRKPSSQSQQLRNISASIVNNNWTCHEK